MRGIISAVNDPGRARECERRGLNYMADTRENVQHLPYADNLFISGDGRIPWELLEAAWQLLENWDVIAPLYSYELLAKDMGTAEEREETEVVCGDLRQPLYSTEMVFIRNNAEGQQFYAAWRQERGNPELALLRAMHKTKPIILQVPCSWLGVARVQPGTEDNPRNRPASRRPGPNLVRVEIGRNRFVMCRPGEEEATRKHFEKMRQSTRTTGAERGDEER